MALGGNWDGGGKSSYGIAVNQTETFSFQLFGTDLSGLDEQSFFDQISVKKQGNDFVEFDGGEFFVARFRGFEDGGSDKVPDPPPSVPEPTTMLLVGTGFLGLAGFRRKFKK